MNVFKQWLLLGVLILFGGCASNIPDAIRKPPVDDVPPTTVRKAPDEYRNKPVRWGGSIVSVRNLKDQTQIEVVSRQLDNDGQPADVDENQGRFLAKYDGFLDPAIYAEGREVTVSGRVDGMVRQTIGDFPYNYPVVRAEQVYLWEKRVPQQSRYPDYYHDPFYDPFWRPWAYPYHPYYRPYYRPRYPR